MLGTPLEFTQELNTALKWTERVSSNQIFPLFAPLGRELLYGFEAGSTLMVGLVRGLLELVALPGLLASSRLDGENRCELTWANLAAG